MNNIILGMRIIFYLPFIFIKGLPMVSSYYLLLSGKPHIIIFLLFFIARALILINDDENKLWQRIINNR